VPGGVLVIIPTYNEAGNLTAVVERLRASVPDAHVLIADDNSPDGTGEIADRLAATDHHVHVMHRAGKEGLGKAYLAGFAWGMGEGYDVLVEMDADGSHRPEELPRLLAHIPHADVVLGSRWVPGGAVVNWPASRRALSRGGSLYTRLALGIPTRDATGGYRAYRTSALRELDLDTVDSNGYCFQIDLLWRALQRGLLVREVPITFVEREIGDSKMSGRIVREALVNVSRWGLARRWAQITGRGRG
jgi:dolichol-phosphate mannosyltransferase